MSVEVRTHVLKKVTHHLAKYFCNCFKCGDGGIGVRSEFGEGMPMAQLE